VVVVAQPAEIVESGHFEVGACQSPRQFLADGVQDADARSFFYALRGKFFRSRGAFLRDG
jgi:hypothetical protein